MMFFINPTIKSVRTVLGISQRECADLLAVNVDTYRKLENDSTNFTVGQGMKLAERFGVDYDDLIFAENSTFRRVNLNESDMN